MELVLQRVYYPDGTNGVLQTDSEIICYTIELPWRDNIRSGSCIPEGRYMLGKRFSNRHNWHLEVLKVPRRSFILIHPASDAALELKGCIAPVQELKEAGKGIGSRRAFDRLTRLVFKSISDGKQVWLRVESMPPIVHF